MRAVTLLALLLLQGCATAHVEQLLRGHTMGSEWTVKLAGAPREDAAMLAAGVQQRFDAVVAQMSTYEPGSDLSRFNQSPPDAWQRLPPELFAVLGYALQLARDTDGAYDPTIGPLVNLWGFGPDPKRNTTPDADAIRAARARVGWRRIELDAGNRSARHAPDTYVDLSSLAKGFGVDEVARYLDAQGVTDYLIDLSGKLRAGGVNARRVPWRVAVERPGPDGNDSLDAITTDAAVDLTDRAVASAGDYRRFFIADGRQYSHIIDPVSGVPVGHALASVTVLAADCLTADALATALLVLGPEAGLAHARRHRIAALFVIREGASLAVLRTEDWP
ncbi:MAG: FAD:protein FMN transferase [Steroidobacteraceae bacterium]